MRQYLLFILVAAGAVLAGCGGPARPVMAIQDGLMPIGSFKPQGEPAETVLSNGTRALTVVFAAERWDLKPGLIPQSGELSAKIAQDAMELPEAERLNRMNHVVNHIQVWAVPLEPGVVASADLKAVLSPSPLAHEDYREPAFLGNGRGYGWYMYAPIYTWVYAQERLRLSDGDDPLAAALRGMVVTDKGMCTRNSCLSILARAGPRALPYAEKTIAERRPERGQIVRALCERTDPQVTAWAIQQVGAADGDVAKAARSGLIARPRREAAALYLKWLEEALGHKDPDSFYTRQQLVKACRVAPVPGLDAVLRQAVQSPSGPRDYMEAFQTLREIAGPPIPKELAEARREIDRQSANAVRYTLDRKPQGGWTPRHVGEPYDQKKVDDAVAAITASPDHDAAAAFGIELALCSGKVDSKLLVNLHQAGLAILRGLPDGKGRQLVSHLQKEFFPDNNVLKELKAVAAQLEKP